MAIYPRVVAAGVMTHDDVRELTQLLHSHQRIHASLDQAAKEALFAHAKTIVFDLRRRALPPHQVASLHLLSYFKETQRYDAGVKFWNWLVRQDASHADARTYGAGIELLAYCGQPLRDLEVLYTRAIALFPGDFSAYHLSPGAIVPDRGRPTMISGVRMSLLQGILTARLLHGDWRNAYLALDTALRLYPTQLPPRIHELFLFERPISEGYKVFMVACRGGNVPRGALLTHLVDRLSEIQSSAWDLTTNAALAVAMINAARAFVGTGGRCEIFHLNALVNGLLGVLYNVEAGSKAEIAVWESVRNVEMAFNTRGVQRNTATYNTIISMGSKLGRPDVVAAVVGELEEQQLPQNAITARTLVAAGGSLQDEQLIRDGWSRLAQLEASLGPRDWQVLARACRKTGDMAFLEEQVSRHGAASSPAVQAIVARETAHAAKTTTKPSPRVSSSPSESLGGLKKAVGALVSQLRSPMLNDFSISPIPMGPLSWPSQRADGEEQAEEALYNRLTTDPHAAATPDSAARDSLTNPPLASTGVTLSNLRFENWRAVNELLTLAERNAAIEGAAVDAALKAGDRAPWRAGRGGKARKDATGGFEAIRAVWVDGRAPEVAAAGDAAQADGPAAAEGPRTDEGWEERSLRLRGISPQ